VFCCCFVLFLLYIIQTTLKYCTIHYTRNSSVGNATRQRAGRTEVGSPEEKKDFSLQHEDWSGSGTYTASYSMSTVVSRGERPEPELDSLLPSSAYTEWTVTVSRNLELDPMIVSCSARVQMKCDGTR
jgi:hypothetical protein